ncbi:MAG: YceI family protein [Bacteroidetes bacterium]|nr:YceI family protein [Bacteroidota bacterium]
MRRLWTIFFGVALIWGAKAQKFSAEKSYIKFYSDAAIEDITAENTKASSIFNEATGEVVFSVPIKEFQFEKSLMKEHFNEKYMESDDYPKATFQGTISGYQASVVGDQKATAKGKINIHGVEHEIEIPGTMTINDGKVVMKAKFMIKLIDYKIKIPQLLWQNVAEQVEVTIEFNYKPL